VEELLLAWFSQNGRDLPWRRTRDPYAILVSEVMSQQYGIEIEDLPAMQGFSG
jgi:A/G-specific adenine glycosylase